MWVHDLRDAEARCGGKAVGLAKLIAAGVDVPPGFVIDDRAFRHVVGELKIAEVGDIGHVLAEAAERIATARIPDELMAAVNSRVGELGHLLAVRSSATIEDQVAGAAAGVFSSRTGVAPDELWEAIRAVWTSALTPLAAAYARRRGGELAIGVIVQEFVTGVPSVVYTRPPGQPTSHEILVQRADHVSRHSRDDLPREIEHQHAAVLALRVEQILGLPTGVDVELVQIRKQSGFDVAMETMVVQARPVVHPTPHGLTPPPDTVLAALVDGRTWHWDVAHNPDPLSTAQQGLVERVERAGIAPWSLRVVAGFLYSAARGDSPPSVGDPDTFAMRAAELEARLEKTLHVENPTVAEAIERYLAFYAIWARELSPLIAAARALPADPSALRGGRPSSVEATLIAGAKGELTEEDVERQLGCLSPAWDVAVPTYAERPGVLRDAVARAKLTLAKQPDIMPAPPQIEETRDVKLARLAAELAERDDALFARAQLLVRKALLGRGKQTGVADDIFWIPLDEAAASSTLDPIDVRRRASAARAAAERASRWQMPLVHPRTAEPAVRARADVPDAATTLRGVGTGPRVGGRVVRFASLASAIVVGPRDVVVARAITPALAVLVAGCAALVSESGGLLDHGAALARELGIPCVVGCRDAWSQLADGMLVTVDGDGGTVTTTGVTTTATQSSSS
ncbi:MAG TPA: PEP/pyruvate-binding domain-containing protein [Kofleriaceae bacterium]|nr:PEP/pyruvate-binding domain-containing protein [Kofleriaceae bacterium]